MFPRVYSQAALKKNREEGKEACEWLTSHAVRSEAIVPNRRSNLTFSRIRDQYKFRSAITTCVIYSDYRTAASLYAG